MFPAFGAGEAEEEMEAVAFAFGTGDESVDACCIAGIFIEFLSSFWLCAKYTASIPWLRPFAAKRRESLTDLDMRRGRRRKN